jgi:4-hydroxyphenylpyruvate dioxygenase-like putative hemolysin
MANTYTLIESQVLGSSAASVTFSSIPADYTDLVLKLSLRTDQATDFTNIRLQINGDTATNYSITRVSGYSTAAMSSRLSDATSAAQTAGANGANSTSNTFSNWEMYIPNYTTTATKPFSSYSVQENNSAASSSAWVNAQADLYRGTSAITTLLFTCQSGSFVSDSSFYLYGIKNS